MKAVFRTDASIEIGSGHVMRCLTLAAELQENGVDCHFICREHPGNLNKLVEDCGFVLHSLSFGESWNVNQKTERNLAHSKWLGATQHEDFYECQSILKTLYPEWLIVDHYALDEYWEMAARHYCRHLLAIDDLADRSHNCDILLDQNLGRKATDYDGLVQTSCTVFVGPKYALLRPEFRVLRPYCLSRRSSPKLNNLFVSMGGVDKCNATSQVLEGLDACSLTKECNITVVMGPHAPWLNQVRERAARMNYPTKVLVDARDVARLIADSDLAFGAAGTSALERCCLGLPTLTAVLADNQRGGAKALEAAGAIILFSQIISISSELPIVLQLLEDQKVMRQMQDSCWSITDGNGAIRIAVELANAIN